MTERSRKLQRLFVKLLKQEDAEAKLAALADTLELREAEGFGEVARMIKRFPDFFSSVDKSFEDYEGQAKLATLNLEKSSAELNETNAKLADLNVTIAAMLDALGQGLFAFNRDGMCSDVYSKACLKLLEGAPANRSVSDILAKDDDTRESMTALLNMLFTEGLPIVQEDILSLLPQQFDHSKGLSVSLAFRPIKDVSGKVHSMLAIATDHTEEVEAKKLSEERERKAQMIVRMSSNRNLFTRHIQATEVYFSELESKLASSLDLDQLRRDVHTYKGNSSIFYLHSITTILNDAETLLQDVTSMIEATPIVLKAANQVLGALVHVKAEAAKIFGEGFDKQGLTRTVELDLLKTYSRSIGALPGGASIAQNFVHDLMGTSLQKEFLSFNLGLLEMADRFGKPVKPCHISGEDSVIIPEIYQGLFESFTHISRNLIAHAAEDGETRKEAGKPEAMNVQIETSRALENGTTWISIAFTDDGAGIDVEKLRHKLTSMAIPDIDTASEADILKGIFLDNISTKDEADELSGRGVGMSAVKVEAEKLGGSVKVDSKRGVFTKITVTVPEIWTL